MVFFYSLDGLCFERPVKEIHVIFRSKMNISLKDTLKMRSGELVAEVIGSAEFFFINFCCFDSPVFLWFVSSAKIVNLRKASVLCANKKRNKKVPKEL